MPTRSLPLLVLSLLLIVLLSACGQERIVYVPVTVTPDGAAATGGDGAVTVPEPSDAGPIVAAATRGPSPTPGAAPDAQSTPVPAASAPAVNPGIARNGVPDAALPAAEVGRIAFMGPMGENSSAMQTFLVNADGTGLTIVSEELKEGYFPALSPDGRRVAFVANTSVDPDIYVMDTTTGETTNLTNKPGFDNQPVWSHDGSQIAFVTDRDGGDVDIWVMDSDGANARRLARTPGEDNLGDWSPDNARIVYSNRNETGESLWMMDVASGESTRLTENADGEETSPDWSPDGERIAFYAVSTNGVPTVYTMRPDGSDRQQITDGSIPALFPVWSPDNQWLLYTAINGNRRDLTALNLASNETRVLPDVQGFATSWAEADELLADTGLTQGPRQTGVEVAPEVLAAAYKQGPDDAPVKIVEFSDYQCPFCQRWVQETYPQLQQYIEDGTVQLIYVDFPLNIHPQAPAAAEAARCAGEQGGQEAYWTMHDALFGGLSRWNGQQQPVPIFQQLAAEAGLDGEALAECVQSGTFTDEVQAGLQEGVRLGITGTPTFFVNGTRLVGAQPWAAFQSLIEGTGGR